MEIKQDINFLDKPLWFQTKKVSHGNGEEGFVWRDIEGFVYRSGYKIPEKLDILLLFFLLFKSQQENYTERIVFTRYEAVKECSLKANSKIYKRLEDALRRWANVTIEFQGTFYDNKEYISMVFHIIDSYEIKKSSGKIEVHLNPLWLLKIKESNFFKYLNFEYYKALKRPVSRRLFEILCKTFKGRKHWPIDLVKLGQKLTLSGKKVLIEGKEIEVLYWSAVLVAIKPAINEINRLAENEKALEALGVKGEEAFKIGYTLSKDKKVITFEKVIPKWVSKEGVEKKASSRELESAERDEGLEELLGLAKSKSSGVERVLENGLKEKGFECVRWNVLYANKEAKKNYEGFLKKALEEDWGKELRAEEERKEEEKKRAVEEQRKRFEESKKLEEEREKWNQKYLSLEEEKQKALWEEAKKNYRERGVPESFEMPKEMLMVEIREILKKRDQLA